MDVAPMYMAGPARPRLSVVTDSGASYSALPHAVLFAADLSDGAVRLYAVLQAHWWGESGECTASHATLAAKLGKAERTIRALLNELEEGGLITSRRAGRGQAKAYRPADPTGRNLPVESGRNLPVERPKRQKSASQAAENSQFKRQKSAASIKKTPVKKTSEEELQPPAVEGAGAPTAAAPDQATILRGLSDGAREILDWHRQCHGRRSPAKLNPESARVLEAAVADLGVERLRESVQFMAGKIPPVPELSKALNAAKTKRQLDEGRAKPWAERANGAPTRVKGPPDWSGFKGRHGGNLTPVGDHDGR